MKLKLLAAGLIGCAFVVACTGGGSKVVKKNQTTGTISGKKIVENSNLSDAEKAEELAIAAEQLVTHVSFFYADRIFDEALKYDADNKRAQLYKHVLAPMMKMKGIMTRIQGMTKKDAKTQADIEKNISENENIALKQFLLDGKEDIKSEKDAQAFLDEVNGEYDKLRKWLKENKDLKLILNLSDTFLKDAQNSKRAYVCQYQAIDEIEIEYVCEKNLDLLKYRIEQADVEGMQQIAAGIQVYNILQNAYELTGVHALSLENRDNKMLTDRYNATKLKAIKEFGLLRKSNRLADLVGLGTDMISGVRWLRDNQATLCDESKASYGQKYPGEEKTETYNYTYNDANGNPVTNSYTYTYGPDKDYLRRPGMLFEQGMCIDEMENSRTTLEKVLEQSEQALKGNVITVEARRKQRFVDQGQSEHISVNMKPRAVIDQPIQDLKASVLTDDKYNACGELTEVADQTLGGLFVDGDGNTVMQQTGVLGIDGDCEGQ